MSENIITPDMPEALKEIKENVTVWISRNGKGFLNEDSARWDGSTHTRCKDCETGFASKSWTICEYCRGVKEKTRLEEKLERWSKLPEGEPDDDGMVYCLVNDCFIQADMDHITDFCDENELEFSDLRLVVAAKSNLREIDYDFFCDDVHEDHEFTKEFETRLKEFNEFLSNYDTRSFEIPNLNHAFKYTI